MEPITTISTNVAKALVKKIYKNIIASRDLEDTYFNFSVAVRLKSEDKDSFLLVSEKQNKYFMPIGGTIKSKEIINSLHKNSTLRESSLKRRSLSEGELAFNFKKDKKTFKRIFFKRDVKSLLDKVISQIDNDLIIQNAKREFKEEVGFALNDKDINHKLGIAVETKRYIHDTERIHVYFIVDLKGSRELYKKIKEKGKSKLIFDKFRRSNETSTVSDLAMIFDRLIDLDSFRKK